MEKLYKNVLVTGTNDKYFHSCLSLIASVHRYSYNTVNQILVYNLGLSEANKSFLNQLQKTLIVEFDVASDDFYEDYLTPSMFAWKTYAIKDAERFGENILYFDSGIVSLESLLPVYQFIEKDQIFLIQHPELKISDLTHQKCIDTMKVTKKETEANLIMAGLQGYKAGGIFQDYINQAFEYSKNRDVIFGDRLTHRHDQSIYSILAQRYKIPRMHSFFEYGEWRRIDYSSEQKAYVHRNTYYNIVGLKSRNPLRNIYWKLKTILRK